MRNIIIGIVLACSLCVNDWAYAGECEYHETNCRAVELEQSGVPGEIVIVCDVVVVCNE